MRAFFASIFAYFLSPFGLLALAALDMSMLFFLPFAVDAGVIILTARRPDAAVLYVGLAGAPESTGSNASCPPAGWITSRGACGAAARSRSRCRQ
jgi:hypothetical protein